FQHGAGLASQRAEIVVLGLVVLGRAALAWSTESIAQATAARATSQLRATVLEHVLRLGPVWLTRERSGELTTLCTRGVDSLDAYFARYLPQLVLACVVPPVIVVVIALYDPLSALLVAVTLPLIPLFMAVVGAFTGRAVNRQWDSLAVLSSHFLDVVAGLTTLKIFGRAKAQSAQLRAVGERYRRATIRVLRISFLSSLALELVATLSVAVVAVEIGLRLVGGSMSLADGLTVLLLAPEAYLPLRMLGQQHHAAADGVGAADRMIAILEVKAPSHGMRHDVPDLAVGRVEIEQVMVRYHGRPGVALQPTSVSISAGEIIAIAGPSGSGKTTLLAVLMGFVAPTSGRVLVSPASGPSVDLADLDPDAWRHEVAYLSQNPFLGGGTLAEAVRLGAPNASDDAVRRALVSAGLDVATLPDGLDTRINEGAARLSAGERRRVALARVFCRDSALVLLDEPTSALDGTTEDAVVDAVRALRARGRSVVVVAHRPALLLVADQVVTLGKPALEPVIGPSVEAEAEAILHDVLAQPWERG
ncbi:MAG: thiol reductant ABC exporter subunit CydD, partial [Candidatus Nanopelagicales bacterium]